MTRRWGSQTKECCQTKGNQRPFGHNLCPQNFYEPLIFFSILSFNWVLIQAAKVYVPLDSPYQNLELSLLTVQITEVVSIDFSFKRLRRQRIVVHSDCLVVEDEDYKGTERSPKPDKVCPDVHSLVVALEEWKESRLPCKVVDSVAMKDKWIINLVF